MRAAVLRRAVVPVLALAFACDGRHDGGGELRARKVVVQREVEGLRAFAARLERGEPMLPVDDVIVAIDDTLLRDLIAAQLPFEADVDRLHLSLREAQVLFRGSPLVRLRGVLNLREKPDLAASVGVLGALVDVGVDGATSTLKARIAVDHVDLEEAAGIEQVLGRATLDEAGRLVRLRIEDELPPVQIPVKVQQSLDLPAVTQGPVRIDGARMPLQIAVSQVVAGQGRLWIAVHVEPGDFVKTGGPPPAGEGR